MLELIVSSEAEGNLVFARFVISSLTSSLNCCANSSQECCIRETQKNQKKRGKKLREQKIVRKVSKYDLNANM